jgi:hypothetical protein
MIINMFVYCGFKIETYCVMLFFSTVQNTKKTVTVVILISNPLEFIFCAGLF